MKPCFQTYFEFFRKRKTVTVMKIKRVKKKLSEKTSAPKVFLVCLSIVYDSFFWNLALALVLELHCYCGDSVKYGLL